MSTITPMLFAWFIHALIAVVVVSPAVFLTKRRVQWQAFELLAFILPFGVWMGLMFSNLSTGAKSLSNLVVEPALLAVGLILGVLARVVMSGWIPNQTASRYTLGGLCLLGALVFWIVPYLPE